MSPATHQKKYVSIRKIKREKCQIRKLKIPKTKLKILVCGQGILKRRKKVDAVTRNKRTVEFGLCKLQKSAAMGLSCLTNSNNNAIMMLQVLGALCCAQVLHGKNGGNILW